jgi:uncharacterized membrane protein YidH (DUF202 family)
MTPARSHAGTVPAADCEDADSGLARERTSLAWTRTAISFAALGGAILKTTPLVGVLVLVMSALIWGIGHLPNRARQPEPQSRHRHLLITGTVTLLSLAALAMVLLGEGSPLHIQ